jgi:hypothetical protein
MFKKLGNAYFFNEKLKEAARWYGELFAMKRTEKRTKTPTTFFAR